MPRKNTGTLAVKIQIDRIPWEGLDVHGELPAAVLGLEHEEDRVRPRSPIICRLHAQIVSHDVLVRGSVSMQIEFACGRCGEFFGTEIHESNFNEVFPVSDPHATLDLTCDIRDSIMLAFPSFPRCGKTCRGLCPRCGTNLNKSACSCNEPVRDDRWAALDVIPGGRKAGNGN